MIIGCLLAITMTVAPVDNAEMKQLFDADQSVRSQDAQTAESMAQDDAARLARTRVLLTGGKLTTANDYFRAAFLFQHGATARDYLLAHVLAMVSMQLGHPDGGWIAAATLDRYLQEIGQSQVLGTQFKRVWDKPVTQEPYDHSLVSDALRQILKVPDQASQAAKRDELEKFAPKLKPPASGK